MTSECYEVKCKNHASHRFDEGPFCYEEFCNFTKERWYHNLFFKLYRWLRKPPEGCC